MDAPDLPSRAGALLNRLRDERTRVHAITNAAAQVFTANLLLAAGGIPSLTMALDEVSAFTSRSDALLVNLGTLDSDRRVAISSAIASAQAHRKPWVLDPVFVDASPPRLEFARRCLARGPLVLRCNSSEFAALAQADPSPEVLQAFARKHGTVVALTGAVDLVTDGCRTVAVENGHPLMARVTAMGCSATVLIAAFAALYESALEAAAAGRRGDPACDEAPPPLDPQGSRI